MLVLHGDCFFVLRYTANPDPATIVSNTAVAVAPVDCCILDFLPLAVSLALLFCSIFL